MRSSTSKGCSPLQSCSMCPPVGSHPWTCRTDSVHLPPRSRPPSPSGSGRQGPCPYWTDRGSRNAPPPEYCSPNAAATHLAENTATFATCPPKLISSLASFSPTSSTGNASLTARRLRISPGDTGSEVLAAARAARWVVTACEGALSPPLPPNHIRGQEAASPSSIGGLHDLTLAPSDAAGGDGHRPGGTSGDGRCVSYKCIRSDLDSSGPLRGGGFSSTVVFLSPGE